MKATEMMQRERRVILRVLECLTAATEHAEAGCTLAVDTMGNMFARRFAGF